MNVVNWVFTAQKDDVEMRGVVKQLVRRDSEPIPKVNVAFAKLLIGLHQVATNNPRKLFNDLWM